MGEIFFRVVGDALLGVGWFLCLPSCAYQVAIVVEVVTHSHNITSLLLVGSLAVMLDAMQKAGK